MEDLSVIDNGVYDLGLKEIEEAFNIQKQIMELERKRNEKLEEAKEHLLLGVNIKIRDLQEKLIICNEQIFYYHHQIDKLNEEIELEKIGSEVQILSDIISKDKKKLSFWINKKNEINALLKELCKRFGHQIDTSEEPARIEENEKYYICKRCGEKVLLDDNFGLKDWEWHNMLNARFTKRIIDQEVSFENPKLVLGKPKVILPNVDK